MSDYFADRLLRLQHYRSRTFASVKRKLPPWEWLDRLLLLPVFVMQHRRFPYARDDRRAWISDVVFDRAVGDGWTALERRAADKVTAPEIARALAPEVKYAERVAVIDVPPQATLKDLQALLAPYAGRMLIAKPAHSCGGMLYLHEASSPEEWEAFYVRATSDYHSLSRERVYLGMPKRIVVEGVIGGVPRRVVDYKVMCANGVPVAMNTGIGFGAQRERVFYDVAARRSVGYDIGIDPMIAFKSRRFRFDAPLPERFDEMVDIARKLCASFGIVRVDLYDQPDGVYFGEFTLTPGGGLMPLLTTLELNAACMRAMQQDMAEAKG